MDQLTTDLPNLRGWSLKQVFQRLPELEQFCQALLEQVGKPRFNIGSGPPGRAD